MLQVASRPGRVSFCFDSESALRNPGTECAQSRARSSIGDDLAVALKVPPSPQSYQDSTDLDNETQMHRVIGRSRDGRHPAVKFKMQWRRSVLEPILHAFCVRALRISGWRFPPNSRLDSNQRPLPCQGVLQSVNNKRHSTYRLAESAKNGTVGTICCQNAAKFTPAGHLADCVGPRGGRQIPEANFLGCSRSRLGRCRSRGMAHRPD